MSIIKKIRELVAGSVQKCGGSKFVCPDSTKLLIEHLDEMAKTSTNEDIIVNTIILKQICAWIEVIMEDNAIIKGERLRQIASDLFANRLDAKEAKDMIHELHTKIAVVEVSAAQVEEELKEIKLLLKNIKKSPKASKTKE